MLGYTPVTSSFDIYVMFAHHRRIDGHMINDILYNVVTIWLMDFAYFYCSFITVLWCLERLVCTDILENIFVEF